MNPVAQAADNARQRSLTDKLARENAPTFQRWKKSPAGLSALGFKKIGPVAGQQEAQAALRAKR